ncbi:MAG: hypothetical protein ACTSUE_03610 [Promethearchaeota archaeon]
MKNTKESRSISTTVVLVLVLSTAFLLPLIHFIPTAIKLNTSNYEKRVAAFYYTWYGNTSEYYGEKPTTSASLLHWGQNGHDPISDPMDIGAANHPTLGTSGPVNFDSCDPDAIRFHLEQANKSGIDTFICTWWGQNGYDDYNFRQVLNITEMDGYNMQHTLYFETVQDQYSKENPSGVTNLYNNFKYILDNYGNHSKFLRIHDSKLDIDRPVIFVYSTFSKPSVENWTDVIDMLHGDGYYPFLIADMGRPDRVESRYYDLFDGIHVYNPLTLIRDHFSDAMNDFQTMHVSGRIHDMLTCVTVLPGYNDTQVRDDVTPLPRAGGSVYKNTWDVAITVNPDWILICSFNEWHEGTEIEPSLENGTFYIDATTTYVDSFK